MSKQRGVELLRDLGDQIAHILHEQAADFAIAIAIANHMRTYWGGQLIYFPKGQAIDIEQRDKAMWQDLFQTFFGFPSRFFPHLCFPSRFISSFVPDLSHVVTAVARTRRVTACYCKELQRSHVPPQACNPPCSGPTQQENPP